MSERHYLACLNLSALMEQAVRDGDWARLEMLQQRWRAELSACVEAMQGEMERDETMEKLAHLLDDVQQKIQLIERAMQNLSRDYRNQANGLRKTQAYLQADV